MGTSQEPFVKPFVIRDVDKLGFGKNPKSMQKGDVAQFVIGKIPG